MPVDCVEFVADDLALFANKIARMIAGDSIKAIAAAMCPPNAMPY